MIRSFILIVLIKMKMKKSTKLLTATSIAAGGILGILFAPGKGSDSRKKFGRQLRKLTAVLNGDCSKGKLLLAKEKLEKHKSNIERHLKNIEDRLARYDDNAG